MSNVRALTQPTANLPRPTPEEPVPKLVGARGLKLLRSGTPLQIIPTLSPEQIEDARQAAREILSSLTPARADEIALTYERLALHYPNLNRTESESALTIEDWFEDLAGYPTDLIAEACRRWRRSPERFFPTPGQLLKSVEPMLKHRQSLGRRALDFLAACQVKA